MALTFKIQDNFTKELAERLYRAAPKAENMIAHQMATDTEPFVPALTKSLVDRTKVIGNAVLYPGPYARYLYYGKVMVDEYGNGPKRFADRFGNNVIRFPKGSKLHATDKNLIIQRSVHPQAQAHWFEASKVQNLEKWKRIAEKVMIRYAAE